MKTCAHPYCDFKWFDKSNTPAQLPTLIQRAPRLSGYCSLSNFAGRHCRKYVITGSSKTKDEYKKGSIEYSMFLSPDEEEITGFSRSRGAKSSTRILNLTIDGIADYDTQRLETKLKDIDGVVDVWIGPFMEGGLRGRYVIVHIHLHESIPSLQVLNKIQELDQQFLLLPYKANSWIWRGHKINYGVAGCGKPIILVHGFGGNAGHFARLIPFLTCEYRVYAIDLLGFGASDKPEAVNYGPELWAEMICDFAKEFAEEGAVLVGNSIGSLTALAAAAKGGEDLFRCPAYSEIQEIYILTSGTPRSIKSLLDTWLLEVCIDISLRFRDAGIPYDRTPTGQVACITSLLSHLLSREQGFTLAEADDQRSRTH